MTDLDPGFRVAKVAHELLDPGPIGHKVRPDVYREFIAANFEDSVKYPVHDSDGTNCAIFVRGCLTQAGIMPRGRRPRPVTAITLWIGVKGFAKDDPDTEAIEGAWIPIEDLGANGEGLREGDVLFWTGYAWQKTMREWGKTTNGHVEILIDGEGWQWVTAGGGGPHHLCKKSDGPKDVRTSHNRPLRGVWRPALFPKVK